PPTTPLFPYTTLFRSLGEPETHAHDEGAGSEYPRRRGGARGAEDQAAHDGAKGTQQGRSPVAEPPPGVSRGTAGQRPPDGHQGEDRESTRLNSSPVKT